ncbi:hypothetical protein NPIL_320141 [Nephila pilipes]|uniref:Endonuclease/exonuclease/phosphatase domain-containing protein n=1 Tax=Nephila pilipes TaxID=299642 RepID=A0A8X6IZX9_NEPPI|nr:hypothetical protein NPIL_320141 [Nephila pilipes]
MRRFQPHLHLSPAAVKPNVASNRQVNKERPVPPITIDLIPRKDLLIKQLRDLTSGRITARVQGTGIKVFPQTTQAYQQVNVWEEREKKREELLARNAKPTPSLAALSEDFPAKPPPAVADATGTNASSIGASLSAFKAPPCRDLLSLVTGFIKISNSDKTRRRPHCLLVGDLNSKHNSWNINTNEKDAGRVLFKHSLANGYKIIAPNEPTHIPYNHRYNCSILDIGLAQGICDPEVSTSTVLSSDHNPSLLN